MSWTAQETCSAFTPFIVAFGFAGSGGGGGASGDDIAFASCPSKKTPLQENALEEEGEPPIHNWTIGDSP